MMDWTDSPRRVLHRCLSKHALLYTEMVTADAVLHGDRARLLGFDGCEHPLALQLGGSDPAKLAEACKIAEDFGYDEINLNVGCPSDRVQSGRFGACLMREPELVAECVTAMRGAVSLPVTVKCRIGVDDQDPEQSLRELIDLCARAGVTIFAVHARKAWLEGLSLEGEPRRAAAGLRSGLSRQARTPGPHHPGQWRHRDAGTGGGTSAPRRWRDAAAAPPIRIRCCWRTSMRASSAAAHATWTRRWKRISPMSSGQLHGGARLHPLIKPMLGLYNGRPGARLFRRHLSEQAPRHDAGIAVLREALDYVKQREAA